MRKMISFLSGAVLGGLVGATLALLFAPSSGQDFQGKVKQSFAELTDEVKRAASDRRQELTVQLETLRQG
jgi:gas vesicle protein